MYAVDLLPCLTYKNLPQVVALLITCLSEFSSKGGTKAKPEAKPETSVIHMWKLWLVL